MVPPMTNETKGMLLGLIAISAFGITLPATKFVVPYLDPIFIGLGRAALAAIVAANFLFWTKQPLPNKQQLLKLLVVALGVVVGFPVLSAWAMKYVPASHGGVVIGILPIATAALGAIISKERPSFKFWLAGLLGSTLVITFALLQGAGELHEADLALLVAVGCAAFGYSVGAKLSKELGGWQVICWALVLAFPFIIFPAILQAPPTLWVMPTSVWGSFLYLALVSQFFGFFLWYKGLTLGGTARVSQVQLLQPFVTIVVSVLLLSESLNWQTIVFALLVVATVGISRRTPIHQKA